MDYHNTILHILYRVIKFKKYLNQKFRKGLTSEN